MTAPAHTPNTDTGLVGDWHVASELVVRADLALGKVGHLGGVEWFDAVTDEQWGMLSDALWMHGVTGRSRRPSEFIRAAWFPLGPHYVAPVGLRIVVLPSWVAPVLYRPDGSRRRCSVSYPPGRPSIVTVSDGGEVVAFVPVVRRAEVGNG